MSDSFAARLAREIGPTDRLEAIAAANRVPYAQRPPERPEVAALQSTGHLGFQRCPHCREFVPVRDICRACGTPI